MKWFNKKRPAPVYTVFFPDFADDVFPSFPMEGREHEERNPADAKYLEATAVHLSAAKQTLGIARVVVTSSDVYSEWCETKGHDPVSPETEQTYGESHLSSSAEWNGDMASLERLWACNRILHRLTEDREMTSAETSEAGDVALSSLVTALNNHVDQSGRLGIAAWRFTPAEPMLAVTVNVQRTRRGVRPDHSVDWVTARLALTISTLTNGVAVLDACDLRGDPLMSRYWLATPDGFIDCPQDESPVPPTQAARLFAAVGT